ncbi:MAG: putative penicillin-binding protein [Friedmanniella sp.]|nr:putative penicillin-binding protein [Friedmanniella sp.]
MRVLPTRHRTAVGRPPSLLPDEPVRPRPRAVGAVVVALLLTGCTTGSPAPNPGPSADSAAAAANGLAVALAAKDVSGVPFVGAAGADVNTQLTGLVRGMGPVSPAVAVSRVETSGDTATARLAYTWTFPGVAQPWTYESQAGLQRSAGVWRTTWQPAVLQPQLDGSNRLSQSRLAPRRGQLLGADDTALVKTRSVFRVGIDKAAVSAPTATTSARRLASLVKVSPAAYADKVAAAGAQAFVEAIVFRSNDPDLPAGPTVRRIPGALILEDQQMLAPTRDFARPVIGVVGEATKEIVDASQGTVVAGDQVGLTGLQKRYDSQLRGTPGVEVKLVPAQIAATPGASPSPTPAGPPADTPVSVFEAPAVAGQALTTTLSLDLQRLAESTLAGTRPASALVAVRPSTGAIVAAASGPGSDGQSTATTGQAPPGSTFKVVTSLALLRAGLTPTTQVSCPTSVTVDGRKFTNYSDYPAGYNGRISLQTALAQSCNTAFIGQRGKVTDSELAQAAGSLGLGQDYDVGFASFFGSVPPEDSPTGRAAQMIGQAKVEASPLAMAAVVASVAQGATVVPHLIQGQKAAPSGTPLTSAEADQLRRMMRAVVTQGSGRVVADPGGKPVIAKTGTAEYGTAKPPRTHAWMIAAQGDLAVAVFVADGSSGSGTAGPLVKRFLAGSR